MNEWRRVVAVLARDDRRRAYASIVLGVDAGLSPAKLQKAVADLRAVGLVDEAGATSVFAELLATDAPVVRTGVDRWLRDGRIARYPTRRTDRLALLEWVASTVPGGALTEREVNDHLASVADDHVSLRRYLVDAGLLQRSADGALYERA